MLLLEIINDSDNYKKKKKTEKYSKKSFSYTIVCSFIFFGT